MNPKTLLIIDDERDIVKLLKHRLEKLCYRVETAYSGQEGIQAAASKKPDLILLDLMFPDMNGLEVFKRIRQGSRTSHIPILMLTAKNQNADEVVGLELGADDYMTKPFDFSVLAARIGNLLKRGRPDENEGSKILKLGKLVVDGFRQKVFVEGEEADLTTTEFRILQFFVKNAGKLLTRDAILDGAWKEPVVISDRAVDVYINGIRKKIKSAAHYLETVRGSGYRFKEAE